MAIEISPFMLIPINKRIENVCINVGATGEKPALLRVFNIRKYLFFSLTWRILNGYYMKVFLF